MPKNFLVSVFVFCRRIRLWLQIHLISRPDKMRTKTVACCLLDLQWITAAPRTNINHDARHTLRHIKVPITASPTPNRTVPFGVIPNHPSRRPLSRHRGHQARWRCVREQPVFLQEHAQVCGPQTSSLLRNRRHLSTRSFSVRAIP